MMVRGKKGTKNVLSTTEIDSLKEEKRELEHVVKESEGFGAGTQGSVDEGAVNRQINKISQSIVDGSPDKTTGKQRDSLEKEAYQLEERFKEGLPTRYEMDHPAKCPGAVRKHMKWLDRNERTGAVDRYRQIQRIMNPGEERSIEALRKDR